MKAVWISRFGGYDVLETRETADPTPQSGQVRIKVEAAGLNFSELMGRQGLYPGMPKTPCVMGYEASGTIDMLGADLKSEFKIGDRVVAISAFGAHASLLCTNEMLVRKIPDSLSFADAAAIPVNYVTAHHMLFRVGNLQPGAHVLVHMAAGGVGTAVLQLCQTVAGVTTYGTASQSKHAYLRSQGCHFPIDYHTNDYAAVVREKTSGRGIDIVIDALGGKDWKAGYELLAPVGHLIAFGFANLSVGKTKNTFKVLREIFGVPKFSPLLMMRGNRSVSGVNMGLLFAENSIMGPAMDAVLELYRNGAIKPHVDRSFPFSRAGEAHAYVEERRNTGKVVLIPD